MVEMPFRPVFYPEKKIYMKAVAAAGVGGVGLHRALDEGQFCFKKNHHLRPKKAFKCIMGYCYIFFTCETECIFSEKNYNSTI